MDWKLIAKVKFTDEKRVLQSFAKTLVKMNAQFTVEFQKDKMMLYLVDPAHIALIKGVFPSEWFVEWKVQSRMKEEDRRVTIDSEKLQQILSKAKKDDVITFEYLLKKFENPDEERKINIIIESERYTKEYSIEADEPDYWPKYPILTFDATIKIKADDFIEYIKEISEYDDSVVVEISDKKVTFRTYITDAESLKISPQVEITTYPEDKLFVIFPIDYLLYLTPLLKLHDEVILDLRTEYPLRMKLSLGEVKTTYLLAPKIFE